MFPKAQRHSIPKAPGGCWNPVVWVGTQEPTLGVLAPVPVATILSLSLEAVIITNSAISAVLLPLWPKMPSEARGRKGVNSLLLPSSSTFRWQYLNKNLLAWETGRPHCSLSDTQPSPGGQVRAENSRHTTSTIPFGYLAPILILLLMFNFHTITITISCFPSYEYATILLTKTLYPLPSTNGEI